MSFNVNGVDSREKMYGVFEIIRNYTPDVVFIPELKGVYSFQLDSLLKTIYKKTTFPNSSCENYFYSKHVLSNYRRLENESDYLPGIFTCNIETDIDTIRFYGCHMASNNYNSERLYITPDSLQSIYDINQYVKDIMSAYKIRAEEAKTIIEDIKRIQKPILIMGDMNDVIGSKALNSLESAGFKDAWWEGGLGYGATITSPLPYRIDHIMFNDFFKLKRIENIDSKGLSDHNAIYAEFELIQN